MEELLHHLGCKKQNLVNSGINYQPQLVNAGFSSFNSRISQNERIISHPSRWDNYGKNSLLWPRSFWLRNDPTMMLKIISLVHVFLNKAFSPFFRVQLSQPGLRDLKVWTCFLNTKRSNLVQNASFVDSPTPRLWGCQTLLRAIRNLRKCVRRGK